MQLSPRSRRAVKQRAKQREKPMSKRLYIETVGCQMNMLDSELVQAAREGKFAVYAVSRLEEAVTLLLGKPAGKADDQGRYPKQSVFGIIQQRLEKMREHERQEHAKEEHKDPSIH